MKENTDAQRIDVLVVEDDSSLREAVVRGLVKAGWVVESVATGGDAIEAAQQTHPSVVVMDVLLPDSGGLGVARKIRSYIGLETIPVLFVTGLSSPFVERALAPAPILLKPFTYAQLISAVRALLT